MPVLPWYPAPEHSALDPAASITARMSSIVSRAIAPPARDPTDRPALVEHQHPAERGESLDVAYKQRLVPGREQIAGDATHEDHVGRAGPNELIGDRDLAAAGIADLGGVHDPSFAYRDGRRRVPLVPPSRRGSRSVLKQDVEVVGEGLEQRSAQVHLGELRKRLSETGPFRFRRRSPAVLTR